MNPKTTRVQELVQHLESLLLGEEKSEVAKATTGDPLPGLEIPPLEREQTGDYIRLRSPSEPTTKTVDEPISDEKGQQRPGGGRLGRKVGRSSLGRTMTRFGRNGLNSATFKVLWRGIVTDVNASGTSAQGYTFLMNYPGYFRNPGGAYNLMTIGSALASAFTEFDEYKVVSLTVERLPFYNVQQEAVTLVDIAPYFILGSDLDDDALWASTAHSLNAQNSDAVRSKFKSERLVFHQSDQIEKMKWLNTNATPSAPDSSNPAKRSSIKLWNPVYPAATVGSGLIVCEWATVMRGVQLLA